MRFNAVGGCCDRCGVLPQLGIPDVYFREPYMDPNLPHPHRPWEKDGVFVTSKEHKARLMREQNLVESGDKVHGMRIFDKVSARRAQDAFHF